MEHQDSSLENETLFPSYDSDESEESNGPEWYTWDEELDDDDKELIERTSESVFYFESDHEALKGNSDYHNLIKTLVKLEAQRIKTIEDINKLNTLRKKIRADPRGHLNKFLSGDGLDIPSRIQVEQVPDIDWSQYSCKTHSNDIPIKTECPAGLSKPEEDVTSKVSEERMDNMTVRGRVFDQTKPQTFNQLWKPEEQLRLEELLVEFPSEKNENNRWRKIAKALGNRTTQQVCSRVQKYFKKLSKAGLPIPGYSLKTNNFTALKKKKRQRKRPEKNSTFFPIEHLGAPQLLDDYEEEHSLKYKLTPEMKADIIEKVIECKKKDAELSPYSHPGIKCIVCEEEPLSGTRWRCLVCHSVSLCSDCVIEQLATEPFVHPPFHPLEPLSNPSLAHWDPDYMPDSFQSSNYLDPNFITSNIV